MVKVLWGVFCEFDYSEENIINLWHDQQSAENYAKTLNEEEDNPGKYSYCVRTVEVMDDFNA